MKRKHIPLAIKLRAALLQLGLDPDTAELHHSPALGLRDRTEDGRYIPDENDPHYLVWLSRDAHAVQTRGRGATTAGSDIGTIAKIRRVTKKQEAFRERLLAKAAGENSLAKSRSRFPAGRGFGKR